MLVACFISGIAIKLCEDNPPEICQETLGLEAMKTVPYLECDANGANSRRPDCEANGIRGYPTWQLDGDKLFPGERSVEELEDMLAGKVKPATPEGTP